MNKRMKKKRALEKRVKKLESVCDFLLYYNTQLNVYLDKLQAIVSENAAATNNRFDAVEGGLSAVRSELGKRRRSFWKC